MVQARPSSISSAVSGTAFIFIGRFADAVIGVLFSVVGAHLMGKEHYGFVGATVGIISIMALLADMGVPNATTKFVSQYMAKKMHANVRAVIFNTLLLEVVLGGLAAILCYGLADTLAERVFGRPELGAFLRFGAPLAFFMPLITAFSSVFQGYQRQEYFALANTTSGAIRLVSSAILLWYNPTVESALLGYLLGAIVASCLTGVLVLTSVLPGLGKRTAPRMPELRTMFRYSLPVSLTAAATILFNWIGTLFLTAFATPEQISWFNIAYGMVAIPILISTSIGTAFFPIISDLHSRGKHGVLRDSYSKAIKFTSLIMLPISLMMMALSQPLVLVLYGPEFMPAYGPFVVLSLWGLIRPIAAISNAVSNGVGKPHLNTTANVICIALALLLCGMLVPSHRPFPLDLVPLDGMMGASWGITIAFSVGMALQIYFALSATKTRLPIDAWARTLVAATLSAIVILLLLGPLLPFLGYQGLLMNLLATVGLFLLGLAMYLCLVKLLKVIGSSDVKLVESMPLPMKGTIVKVFRALASA